MNPYTKIVVDDTPRKTHSGTKLLHLSRCAFLRCAARSGRVPDKVSRQYISRIFGRVTARRFAIISGMFRDLADIINRAKFCIYLLRGLGFYRVQSSGLPKESIKALTVLANALPCDLCEPKMNAIRYQTSPPPVCSIFTAFLV